MPAKPPEKILLTCPHCGHQQREPRAVISTVCKGCSKHFRANEVPKATAKAKAKERERPKELRPLTCFDCGTKLEVAVSAQSTMCKRCSAHIDLRDYHIANAVSKNFKTKGEFVIEQKGYVSRKFGDPSGEVARLRLDGEAIDRLLATEIDTRLEAAADYERHGRTAEAQRLREEAELIARYR